MVINHLLTGMILQAMPPLPKNKAFYTVVLGELRSQGWCPKSLSGMLQYVAGL